MDAAIKELVTQAGVSRARACALVGRSRCCWPTSASPRATPARTCRTHSVLRITVQDDEVPAGLPQDVRHHRARKGVLPTLFHLVQHGSPSLRNRLAHPRQRPLRHRRPPMLGAMATEANEISVIGTQRKVALGVVLATAGRRIGCLHLPSDKRPSCVGEQVTATTGPSAQAH